MREGVHYDIDERGCWIWKRSVKTVGYGQLHVPGSGKNGKTVTAHRWSWEQNNGPVPDGLQVCHHCDVRRCVNPDHLFLGSQQDNMIDMSRKDRTPRKLTPEDVQAILNDPRPRRAVAKDYGIAGSSVSRIRNGRLHAAWTGVGL